MVSIWDSGVFLLLHLDLGEWEPLKSVAFAGARLFEEFLRPNGAYSGFYPLCAPQKAIYQRYSAVGTVGI